MTKGKTLLLSAVAVTLLGATALATQAVASPKGHHGEGGPGGRGMPLMERFDVNKDGKITQAEIDAVQAENFTKTDTDKSGGVSLDEFQTYWLAQMRERMVDGFQRLDADGDGQVTQAEFSDRASQVVSRLDRDDDGDIDRDDFRKGKRGHWFGDDDDDDHGKRRD
ncbi:MAG: EF-hand domain-containing protein [Magnetospiraceae bacterium]